MLLLMTGTEAGRADVPPGSVAAIDPATNRVVGAATVGDGPTRVLATARGVWVLNQVSQTLSLVDPEMRDPVRTFGVGAIPADLAVDGRGLWVASTDGQVALVDPATETVVRRFKVRVRPKVLPNDTSLAGQLASGFGSLWIAGGGRTLARVDPETGRTVATIHGVTTGLGNEGGIAVGKDSLWTADLGNVTRIDPVTNTAQRVPLGVSLWHINGLAADGRNVWLGDVGNNRVWEVGGITPQVIKSVAVGLNPAGLAFGHGSLWVTNAGDGTLMRIDPKTGGVMATITVGGAPIGVAVGRDAVWVTVD
jgi:YVTN family beta-propeller protein